MRISTSQIYASTLSQLNSSLTDVMELNTMNTTQKRINSPSDDPAGMGLTMELRAYDSSLSGYVENCSVASSMLSLQDEEFMLASEQITAALELAEQGSTGTYEFDQLVLMAEEAAGYVDSLFNIANTKYGEDSVFAGDDLGDDAYEYGLGVSMTNDTLSNGNFTSVTGEIDSTLSVRFDETGTVGGTDDLDYSYSTDGGQTWTSAVLAAGDTTLVIDDCEVEMLSGTAVTEEDEANGVEGSEFLIRTAVYYTGSDKDMDLYVAENTEMDVTTVGSEYFGGIDPVTGEAYEAPNLFESLCELEAYLAVGDADGVADALEELREAQTNLEAGNANVGARENRASYMQQSQGLVQEVLASSISMEEDANATQLAIELEQANYVYEAVISSTAKIIDMSLLNYI
jgi:flagellar hook-associated protein 3 FlgL